MTCIVDLLGNKLCIRMKRKVLLYIRGCFILLDWAGVGVNHSFDRIKTARRK